MTWAVSHETSSYCSPLPSHNISRVISENIMFILKSWTNIFGRWKDSRVRGQQRWLLRAGGCGRSAARLLCAITRGGARPPARRARRHPPPSPGPVTATKGALSHEIRFDPASREGGLTCTCLSTKAASLLKLQASCLKRLRPISLLRLSLLRFADSKLLGNSLWTWEFHHWFVA